MNKKNFLTSYFKEIKFLLDFDEDLFEKIISLSDLLIESNSHGKKTLIFGNGGSSAIVSHSSVDLTKNAKIRCVNLNEYDLITCFANDYGYDKWVEKAIEFYADEGDNVILISASGNSPNMINGAKAAKNKKVNKIVTCTGNEKDNKLNQLGDVNFWINSKSYNHVENVHQIILLSVVDLIIGKSEYPPN